MCKKKQCILTRCGNITRALSGIKNDSKEVNTYCKCCLDVLK